MKIFVLIFCFLFTSSVAGIVPGSSTLLHGAVDSMPVLLRISWGKNSTFTGSYSFVNKNVAISIAGTITKDNRLFFSERDESVTVSNTFSGKFVDATLKGVWKFSGKNSSFDVVFIESAPRIWSASYVCFNKSYRMQLNLNVVDNKATAKYFYEREGKESTLEGYVDPNGDVVLKSASSVNGVIETYTLHWLPTGAVELRLPDNTTIKAVETTERLRLKSLPKQKGAFDVVVQTKAYSSSDNNCAYVYEYPIIKGSSSLQKLNTMFVTEATSSGLNCMDGVWSREYKTVDVATNSPTIVSMVERRYRYFGSELHPEFSTQGRTFDMSTGKEIQLQSILKESSFSAFSDVVMQKLQEQQPTPLHPSFIFGVQVKGSSDFYITPTGITLNFDCEEITHYAFGEQEVHCTWEEISGFLLERSPITDLWQPR